jgi:hypothetical protein
VDARPESALLREAPATRPKAYVLCSLARFLRNAGRDEEAIEAGLSRRGTKRRGRQSSTNCFARGTSGNWRFLRRGSPISGSSPTTSAVQTSSSALRQRRRQPAGWTLGKWTLTTHALFQAGTAVRAIWSVAVRSGATPSLFSGQATADADSNPDRPIATKPTPPHHADAAAPQRSSSRDVET